jgi:hypothetical protein
MRLTILLAILLTSPAFAHNFYVGGEVGQAYVDSILGDAQALAYGGFAGWQVNKHVALEAAYRDLSGGHTVDLDAVVSQDLSTVTPLPKCLEIFGRLGVSFLGIDQAIKTGRHHKSPPFDYSQDCLNFGGGVGYTTGPIRTRLGLEWISADGLSILRVATVAVAVKF